jgi:4-hydroxybenzoate polyprenyltransferase
MALYPAAVAAGGALALANGLVDLERDARSERPTAAVALGASRAWAIHLVLVAVLATLSVALAPLGIWDRAGAQGTAIAASALRSIPALAVGLGLVALGLGALALRAHEPAVRERGWELEAVGVAVVGVGWLAGVATTTGA